MSENLVNLMDQLGRVGGGRRVGQVDRLVQRFPRTVFLLFRLFYPRAPFKRADGHAQRA